MALMLLKQRNRLLIQKGGDLRLYLTKMSPNISNFCEGCQAHPSHWPGDHSIHQFLWIKFFKNTTLCLFYQAWGVTMMCWEWNDGTKKFEKHCFKTKASKLPHELFLGPWWCHQKSLDLPQLWHHSKKVQTQNFQIFKKSKLCTSSES